MTQVGTSFPATEEDLRISAVIPVYNRAHLIGRAIESVLRQSKPPAEIIVVDDGSTDGTREQVASFGNVVRYVYQPNSGAAVARNRGVREAESEWIAFLDSDDLWLETHLERMARAICATSGIARFYFADTILTAARGGVRLWEFCGFEISGDYELTMDATDWVMMCPQPTMLQSSVFKRSAYLESGGLWERLRTRQDTHFFLKLGIGGAACAVAACGTQMTADDDPGNRNTSAHDATNPTGYWHKLWLYQDILSRATNLKPDHKRELRGRLAHAHRRLARLAWDERRPFAAARLAGQSALIAPRTFLQRLPSVLKRLFGN